MWRIGRSQLRACTPSTNPWEVVSVWPSGCLNGLRNQGTIAHRTVVQDFKRVVFREVSRDVSPSLGRSVPGSVEPLFGSCPVPAPRSRPFPSHLRRSLPPASTSERVTRRYAEPRVPGWPRNIRTELSNLGVVVAMVMS